MGIFTRLFRSRDKPADGYRPQNKLGSAFSFFFGGTTSGKTVNELDEPVTKNCYAVFAMLKAQTGDYTERNCISCGECRAVCPVGMDPEELYKQKISDFSDAFFDTSECQGCGCCEVVCPSHLPLADIITGKPAEIPSEVPPEASPAVPAPAETLPQAPPGAPLEALPTVSPEVLPEAPLPAKALPPSATKTGVKNA